MPIEVDCRQQSHAEEQKLFVGFLSLFLKISPWSSKLLPFGGCVIKFCERPHYSRHGRGLRDSGEQHVQFSIKGIEAENYSKTVALYISHCHKSSIRLLYWMEQIHFSYVKAVVQKATALKKKSVYFPKMGKWTLM